MKAWALLAVVVVGCSSGLDAQQLQSQFDQESRSLWAEVDRWCDLNEAKSTSDGDLENKLDLQMKTVDGRIEQAIERVRAASKGVVPSPDYNSEILLLDSQISAVEAEIKSLENASNRIESTVRNSQTHGLSDDMRDAVGSIGDNQTQLLSERQAEAIYKLARLQMRRHILSKLAS